MSISNQRATRRSLRRSHFALARADPTAAVFRFSCPRCAWSGCPAPPSLASIATQGSQVSPLTRGPQGSIKGLRRPVRRRGRRIVRTSAATSPCTADRPGAMSGSPIGQRAAMPQRGGATKVARASRAISGERALLFARRPPGHSPLAVMLDLVRPPTAVYGGLRRPAVLATYRISLARSCNIHIRQQQSG